MLRGALVGFGNVAQFGHWPAYAGNPEARIVAIVEGSAARREAAAQLDHSLGLFSSLAEIEMGALDFVDICTPPALHFAPMCEALARGWHVLCEKPFLLEQAQLAQVREAAAQAHVAVLPAHNWKYAPLIRAATEHLRAGAIGELQRVEIRTLRMQDAAAADPAQPNWRRDPRLAGGGILMDHGWHAVYLVLHWLGKNPHSLQAQLHRPSAEAVEDEALLEMDFAGAEARIELSWNARERSNHLRLVGARGELLLADDRLQVNGRSTPFQPALSHGSHHADWFRAMVPDVLAAFRRPELARPLFDEAASCLEIIQQAYATAQWRTPALTH